MVGHPQKHLLLFPSSRIACPGLSPLVSHVGFPMMFLWSAEAVHLDLIRVCKQISLGDPPMQFAHELHQAFQVRAEEGSSSFAIVCDSWGFSDVWSLWGFSHVSPLHWIFCLWDVFPGLTLFNLRQRDMFFRFSFFKHHSFKSQPYTDHHC